MALTCRSSSIGGATLSKLEVRVLSPALCEFFIGIMIMKQPYVLKRMDHNLKEYDENRSTGYYQIPTLKACHYVPEELIGFNYVKGCKEKSLEGIGVHFFIDDYQFERIWTMPHENIKRLKNFSCVLTPDFSLYMDMPRAMKIWNTYRSRLIGQIMQNAGLNVIPTLSWAEDETYEFCFEGIEQGSVIAVTTRGVVRHKNAQKIWRSGMDFAIKKLKPQCVICYGTNIEYDFGNTEVKYFAPRK